MFNKDNFKIAERIKGYGSYDNSVSDEEIQRIKTVKGDVSLKVQPKIIRNLKEFIDYIDDIEPSYTNPVFFRGQTNADYLLIPNSLRENPENEHLMIEAFSRRFFDELNKCYTSMEKLMLMQHFLLPTRCLDISESPLMALYFACSHMKKFRKKIITQKEESWGEIILFREPKVEEKRPEKLKSIESSNISIIANTAYMEKEFSLWYLGARWKKDVDVGHDEKYIDLQSIVRSSYIVRVPQNNPRIKNQQGAFIMTNANFAYVYGEESKKKDLTELILKQNGYFSYNGLMNERLGRNLDETGTWNLKFEKIMPYSKDSEIEIFKTDPFNLKRLFYKKNGIQQVVLIPPDAKPVILRELALLNITEDFVYPDMDNVANEINEKINLK